MNARRILEEFDSALSRFQLYHRGFEGIVSLAALSSVASITLPAVISEFRRRNFVETFGQVAERTINSNLDVKPTKSVRATGSTCLSTRTSSFRRPIEAETAGRPTVLQAATAGDQRHSSYLALAASRRRRCVLIASIVISSRFRFASDSVRPITGLKVIVLLRLHIATCVGIHPCSSALHKTWSAVRPRQRQSLIQSWGLETVL